MMLNIQIVASVSGNDTLHFTQKLYTFDIEEEGEIGTVIGNISVENAIGAVAMQVCHFGNLYFCQMAN